MNEAEDYAAPLGPVTGGRLRFLGGASYVTIRADPSTGDRYRAHFGGSLPANRVDGGAVTIKYPWTLSPKIHLSHLTHVPEKDLRRAE